MGQGEWAQATQVRALSGHGHFVDTARASNGGTELAVVSARSRLVLLCS